MAQPLVSDELWSIIEPHIPVKPRRTRNPVRNSLPDRAYLAGILFVLKSGIPWEMLPKQMGCGSGMTCWRRLHAWKRAGVWQTVHRILLNQLWAVDAIDFKCALVDSGLGKVRWAVERTISWLHQFRRLRMRCERRPDIHDAFLTIGCILICHRILENSFC